jgi:hypothetical protein
MNCPNCGAIDCPGALGCDCRAVRPYLDEKDFIKQLTDAGWRQSEAEQEWQSIQNESESGEDDIYTAVAKHRQETNTKNGVFFAVVSRPEGFVVVRQCNATGAAEYIALCREWKDAGMIAKAMNMQHGQHYCSVCCGAGRVQIGLSEQPCGNCSLL